MAKETKQSEEKSPTKFKAESAAMVSTSNSIMDILAVEQMPDQSKVERMNLPPMLEPKTIAVGTTVSGVLVGLVENFTGREDMRKARLLHLKHKSGTEFLFPLTGTVRNAFKSLLNYPKKDAKGNVDDTEFSLKDEAIGDTFFFKRLPDGSSKKYGGKAMYSFDVLRQKQ